MSGLSLVFEPTFPLFFGDTRELSPIMAPESKLLPSIYTMAGAAMTLLRARGFETTTLEKIISEGRLKIMGPYIRVRGRAYVPAPRYLVKIRKDGTEEIQSVSIVEELWIESSLIRKVGYLSDNKAEYHEGFLVPLDSLPNPSPSDVVEIKKEPRERLGIALDRQRRTAREGLMYTKVEFEWLSVDDEAPKFCIDLCAHEELLEGRVSIGAPPFFVGDLDALELDEEQILDLDVPLRIDELRVEGRGVGVLCDGQVMRADEVAISAHHEVGFEEVGSLFMPDGVRLERVLRCVSARPTVGDHDTVGPLHQLCGRSAGCRKREEPDKEAPGSSVLRGAHAREGSARGPRLNRNRP